MKKKQYVSSLQTQITVHIQTLFIKDIILQTKLHIILTLKTRLQLNEDINYKCNIVKKTIILLTFTLYNIHITKHITL
jgi:hypothetical protein